MSGSRSAPLARLLKNTGILLGGNSAASVMNFVAVALTARVLGPEAFGVLAVIQAFARTVDRLINFQSWQAIIKYGAEALEHKREAEFRQLIAFGTWLDVSTALLGTVIAVGGVYWLGPARGLDAQTIQLTAIYSAVIFFNLSGTPEAALRLFDRFRLFAVQQTISASLRLAGVLVASIMGAGLSAYVSVWIAAEITKSLVLLWCGWFVLGQHGFPFWGTMRTTPRGITQWARGLWAFVWTTNLNSSLKLGIKELDVILVGGILGSASAGLYKVARQCAKMLGDLTGPLQQAAYPELARLWARHDLQAMRSVVIRVGGMAGGTACLVWIASIVFGKFGLRLAFGNEFVPAQPVLAWYVAALTLASATIALTPVALTVGRPQAVLWANIASAAVYFPALLLLLRSVGLAGAGMAYVLYYLVWSTLMVVAVRGVFRGRISSPTSGPESAPKAGAV